MLKLFEKTNIGRMKLKNRIVMAPMGTTADVDGGYNERSINYFVERAKGGVGLIITGANIVSTKYEDRPCNQLDNFHQVDRLGLLADKVHQYGAKLCVQITPGLGRMVFTDPFTAPYSASAVKSFWFPDLICKELSVGDIHFLVEKMGYSASLAKAAGADAVELHAYGGYLIDQFHSRQWNIRTDEYGGNLEARMKFTKEIIAEVKKNCGDDFPVLVKYTPYHGVEGGRELAEGLDMAKILEKAGATAIHVDVGCYEAWYKAISTVYEEEGHQIPIFEAVKKVVTIPVIGQGKLFNPELAEAVLEDNKTDFVALGHQMLADPDWPNKVKAGKNYDIIPCIGCNECLNAGFSGKCWSCSVNPSTYHEADYPLPEEGEKRSVLVIGGGPGGMEAAITAKKRGYDVELWEKSSKLGGTLLAAGAPSFKKDVINLVSYLVNMTYRVGVNVKTMKDTNVKEIIAKSFDKVIVATGSHPLMPPIPGIDCVSVKSSTEILLGEKLKKDVVVIGGGLVGCETAAHIAETADNVTIIEMLGDVLLTADHCKNNDQSLRHLIASRGIHIIAPAKVTKIDETGVFYEKDGVVRKIACDTVVIAAGYKSNNSLASELEDRVKDLSVVGDATKPRKIMTAIHEGYHAIRLMN
ncbi:NAD(P)/FAD-dependent oxidoreductase [Clostridium psychrophilum]|uniref:NAD(P)/FAD-dependent oxidoreductase n=1 Tax=Clostridium psychrophilum TaxID=132926 RepID=UPI001C0D3E1D|nr:NAD(P)/FAD-dependent oxidoreductase [Clostridium psychrophilum]MBU3182872.1 FAD-dependent oxidoreductase [Clostridium psychrophilum]